MTGNDHIQSGADEFGCFGAYMAKAERAEVFGGAQIAEFSWNDCIRIDIVAKEQGPAIDNLVR